MVLHAALMNGAETKLVSVLIPAYNVQNDIADCLASVLRQTYRKLEIIIVDDGSTDDTLSVCRHIADQDPRVTVYAQTNRGLAETRNVLLSHAHGGYVTFIDSDDFVDDSYVETLLEWLVVNKTDIAICGRCEVYGSRTILRPKPTYSNRRLSAFMAIRALNCFNSFDVSSCGRIYKRKIFAGIRYPSGKTSEDAYVTYRLIDKAQSVYYRDIPLYCYRQREGSISRNTVVHMDYAMAADQQADYFRDRDPRLFRVCRGSTAIARMAIFNLVVLRRITISLEQRGFLLKGNIRRFPYVLSNRDISAWKKIQVAIFAFCPPLYAFLIRELKGRRTE